MFYYFLKLYSTIQDVMHDVYGDGKVLPEIQRITKKNGDIGDEQQQQRE